MRTAGAKSLKSKKPSPPEEQKIDSRDNKGRFGPGNNFASFKNPEKQAIRERLCDAITKEDEIDTIKSLLTSKNENVKLQALTLVWHYRYGKPTQVVESDTTLHVDDKRQMPEEVEKLLAELQK